MVTVLSVPDGGWLTGGLTVRMPAPVRLWPSGLVTVTSFAPRVAAVVLRFNVTDVGLVYVTLLTTTPPLTVAVRWLKGSAGDARSAPGSKKPEPETCTPVTTTFTPLCAIATVGGLHEAGVAGGRVRS